MASRQKVYKVRGTFWRQRELRYGELLDVTRLLKDKLKSFSKEPDSFADWVDELDRDGLLPKFIDAVVQRHEPTVFHRWWNSWRMRRLNMSPPLIQHMKAQTIARAVVDFFLLNTAFIDDLANTRIGSRSLFRRRVRLGDLASILMSYYFAFQTETTSKRNGSEKKMPTPSNVG
jgi:hypothetical protein